MSSGTLPVRKQPTYADIEGLPPNVVGEIIAGELVVSPRPAPWHALVGSALGGLLEPPFGFGRGGPGGWWIIDEPELHLGVDPAFAVVVPDLGGWRVERMPELPDTAYFGIVPDWVCEILSPRTAAVDRVEKLPFYGRAEVSHAWVIDPQAKTLEVFRHTAKGYVLADAFRGDVNVRAEPFEAVELELRWLWGRPQ